VASKLNRDTVVALFHDQLQAEQAIGALHEYGFNRSDVSMVRGGREGEVMSDGTMAGTGAAIGAGVGGGAAALASLGITFGVIPVVGPVLAIGPLAAALLSAVGGAAAGGLVGGLIGLGIPEEDAQFYETEVGAGRSLVTVHAGGRYYEAWDILRKHGAYNRQYAATSMTGPTPM
jgi:hypothetical protein